MFSTRRKIKNYSHELLWDVIIWGIAFALTVLRVAGI
jgi:hypothetical protein